MTETQPSPIACPACNERQRLTASRDADGWLYLLCTCGHVWTHHTRRCADCGTALRVVAAAPEPQPVQRDPIRVFAAAAICPSCHPNDSQEATA